MEYLYIIPDQEQPIKKHCTNLNIYINYSTLLKEMVVVYSHHIDVLLISTERSY